MNHLKTNHSCSSHCLPVRMTLAALALLALASIPVARAGEDSRAPDLPSPLCDRLQLSPGDKVAFHVYALGVQIYRWNGTSWVFCGASGEIDRRRRVSRGSRHSLRRPDLGEPQWRQSDRQPSGRLHPRSDRHSLVAAPDRLDRRPRHFRSRDLHPPGEHLRRFSSHCSRPIHRR